MFYSNLNIKNISEFDGKHAPNLWNVFETKNLGDYHDL